MTMSGLKQKLPTLLKGAVRIAVVGIGSELRGDDAVGLLVLERLREKISKQKKSRLSSISKRCNVACDVAFRAERGILSKEVNADEILHPLRTQDDRKGGPIATLDLKLFNGGTAPENLTGEIRRFKPGHLIMIDAVELGKRPGTVALVDVKKVENTAFLTHKLPIKLMLDYLASEMTFTTVFIGIQPRSLEFEGKISKPVIRAGAKLADLLFSSL